MLTADLVFLLRRRSHSHKPTQAYQGQSLARAYIVQPLSDGSSPQGISKHYFEECYRSAFAVSDSTNVSIPIQSITFWKPAPNLAQFVQPRSESYTSLFSGPTTDYSLSNAFTVNAATATISALYTMTSS